MELTGPTATARTELTATDPTEPTATEPTGPIDLQAFPALSSLIGATALQPFLAGRLGKNLYRTRLPEGLPDSLFGWDRLNTVLAEHRLGPPRLKLEKDGGDAGKGVFRQRRTSRGDLIHNLDTAALYARLRDGATLILDAVHELSPPLGQLCAGLATEFSAHSQANLYACWGTSQGFDVHWDDHDVFIIQLDGVKRWRLYGFTRPAPLRREADGDPAPAEPVEELLLSPGELLYLPRGYWHAAVGTGGPTLHLTVGLTRKTGHDLIQWVADQALSDPVVRADLPLQKDDAALGRHLAGVLQAALRAEDPTALARAYRRSVEAARGHRPQLSFPHIGGEDLVFGPDAAVRLADGAARLRPADDGGAVILSHRGVDYTVAGLLEPALNPLVLGRPVTIREFRDAVSGAPEAQVEAFLRDMLSGGVFVISAR